MSYLCIPADLSGTAINLALLAGDFGTALILIRSKDIQPDSAACTRKLPGVENALGKSETVALLFRAPGHGEYVANRFIYQALFQHKAALTDEVLPKRRQTVKGDILQVVG